MMDFLLRQYYRRFFSPFYSFYLRCLGVSVGVGVVFYGKPIITKFRNSSIHIGDNVVICSSGRFTALGVRSPVVIRTLSETAEIHVDRDVGMSGAVICAQNKVSIGAECLLGSGVTIMDTDFHPLNGFNRRYSSIDLAKNSPVIIEDNVFIGAYATVLRGGRVGAGSVVGACSVVRGEYRANVICAGNVAKIVGSIGL